MKRAQLQWIWMPLFLSACSDASTGNGELAPCTSESDCALGASCGPEGFCVQRESADGGSDMTSEDDNEGRAIVIGTADAPTPDEPTRDTGGDGPEQDSDDDEPTQESSAPLLTLEGPRELVLDCGEAFVEPGASAIDGHGAELQVEVSGADAIDTQAPGHFTIVYSARAGEGPTAEARRDVYVCGPACGDLGKEPVPLAGWTPLQLAEDLQPVANWSVAADGLSVTQTLNADPSVFVSDFDATDLAIEGKWTIGSSSDDGIVGFVFGYQDSGHFYLFDWKQTTQSYLGGVAEAGMGLKVVSADPLTGGEGNTAQLTAADLWYTEGTDFARPILQDGVALRTDVGWSAAASYTFFLEFHAGSFRIEVQDEGGATLVSWSVEDDTYQKGAFAFYNFSQGNVGYESFTKRVTPLACSTVLPQPL